MLLETRIESAPVKGKMELVSAASGDEIILDEIVVGEAILIVAIEWSYSIKIIDFLYDAVVPIFVSFTFIDYFLQQSM